MKINLGDEVPRVTEIVFGKQNNQPLSIDVINSKRIRISDNNSIICIEPENAAKLLEALELAKTLGWFK